MHRLTPTLLLVVIALMVTDVSATGRFYGTLSATYQHFSRETNVPNSGDSSNPGERVSTYSNYGQSELLVNYDDLLFTKNSMRLASRIMARQVDDAGKWEVRPIYYLDVKSHGYAYSGSFSPYSQSYQLRLTDGQVFRTKVYYRDWRNAVTINYPRYPSASLTYNSNHTYDRLETKRVDTRSRNVIFETNYAIAQVAMRGNITQSRTTNTLAVPQTSNTFRTYNGTVSYSDELGKAGYISSAYSVLDTRIESQATATVVPLKSRVHSVTGFYSTPSYKGIAGSASYSGRFTRSVVNQFRVTSRDENFSGQIGYAPFGFLSFDLSKIYQIGSRPDGYHISEYTTISSTLRRYLRRGVDTRLSWARTYFQRVDRGEDTTQSPGGYSVDNWYASLAAQPYPHTRLLADLSISRNNESTLSARRYLVSRSLNLVLNASRKLEGRIGASYSYQGPVLSLDRSYTRSMNLGATYYPGSNINVNLTYVHSVINSSPRLSNSSLSTYFGYTYRQAFSVYVSVNRQLQEVPDRNQALEQKSTLRPYGVNGQVQIRLSPRSNLTFGYIHTSGSGPSGPLNRTGIFQAVFNGQF